MTLSKTGLLSLTVPAILATWLAAEAATESSHDNLPAKLKPDLTNVKRVRVSLRDGLLSVEAKAGTWRQVLNGISEQTGIRFHHTLPLVGSVTVSFANLPVRQAIERLLPPEADFVFRYQVMEYSSEPLTKEVWIVGKVGGDSAARIQGQRDHRLATSVSQQYPSGKVADMPMDTTEVEQHELERLLEMTKSSNATMRVEALSILKESGTGDQEEIRAGLAAALAEQDPKVRNLGVKAIASEGGAEAVGQLARVLHDPDLSVRIAAIESMPLEGEGSALLQEALADPDGIVRSCAQDRLQEAESQRAD